MSNLTSVSELSSSANTELDRHCNLDIKKHDKRVMAARRILESLSTSRGQCRRAPPPPAAGLRRARAPPLATHTRAACRVRLLVHARSGAAVALKVARGHGQADGAQADGAQADGAAPVQAREAALHRALRHPHVLRCLGERTHQGLHYLFLEYAAGGELFDRIGEARARGGGARRGGRSDCCVRRAGRGHVRGGGAALLAAAAGRPGVPARPRGGAP